MATKIVKGNNKAVEEGVSTKKATITSFCKSKITNLSCWSKTAYHFYSKLKLQKSRGQDVINENPLTYSGLLKYHKQRLCNIIWAWVNFSIEQTVFCCNLN